jgi:hypothetical protein
MVANSPENKRVSGLFSVTTDTACCPLLGSIQAYARNWKICKRAGSTSDWPWNWLPLIMV